MMINLVPSVVSEKTEIGSFSDEMDSRLNIVPSSLEDLDPLVDQQVTVEITKIRAFDRIDRFSDPDFYVKVFINDNEFESPVWKNTKYVDNPNWAVTCDIPEDQENVTIKIQLWDWNLGVDRLCDIASNNQKRAEKDIDIIYNVSVGHWYGDDYNNKEPTFNDPSGYGRANGCDDNSFDREDRDCELYFNIYQNDFDGDNIPYWTEVNIYGTNPEIDNTGEDTDNDSIPIEWEHKWGWSSSWWGLYLRYSPLEWNDHKNLDLDKDGLDNYEEYLTSQYGSDPHRKDFFLELDQMQVGPNGEGHFVPEESMILFREPFDKRNIVFHLDDGNWGGGEILPFDKNTSKEELENYYLNHFLNGDLNYWRRGIFHYGLVIYRSDRYPGFVWRGEDSPYLDCWQISTRAHDNIATRNPFYSYLRYDSFKPDFKRARIYAGAMMHENGHTLGIMGSNTPGCDDQDGKYPYEVDYWRWRNYKSVMNYRYVYGGLDNKVDYSDGSHGRNDFDDWARIDLQFFQRPLF
jgi:hypothetical protein